MDEEVLALVVRGDESEPLVVAEPLDGSGCHVGYLLRCVPRARRKLEATTCERLHYLAGSWPARSSPTVAAERLRHSLAAGPPRSTLDTGRLVLGLSHPGCPLSTERVERRPYAHEQESEPRRPAGRDPTRRGEARPPGRGRVAGRAARGGGPERAGAQAGQAATGGARSRDRDLPPSRQRS